MGAALALAVATTAVTIHAQQPGLLALPLTAGQMPGFEPVAARQACWQLQDGWRDVPEQVWRHLDSAALVEVKYAAFDSPAAALAACEAEAAATQLIAEPGTFSGARIGDRAWRWPLSEVAGRLMFCKGCEAVSIHITGRPVPQDTAPLLECVGRAALGAGPGAD